MAQFDVYRVRGGSLAVDCQSDLLRDLPTCIVAPLRPADDSVMQRLTPVFEVEGRDMTMVTPLVGAVARRDLEQVVTSLAGHEYEIKAALDLLISGF